MAWKPKSSSDSLLWRTAHAWWQKCRKISKPNPLADLNSGEQMSAVAAENRNGSLIVFRKIIETSYVIQIDVSLSMFPFT
jgi:hypothetical protein